VNDGCAGPIGCCVRHHALSNEDYGSYAESDAVIVGPEDVAAEKLLVERAEFAGVGAIE